MSADDCQEVIDAFIERQRDNFHQLVQNLSIYYQSFRSQFAFPTDKSQQRYLYLTVLLSLILLTIIYLIIVDYQRLVKLLRTYFRFAYSYWQVLFTRIRNKFLQKTTPSLLNILLNRRSHIREKFSQEFLRAINQELFNRKVKYLFHLKTFDYQVAALFFHLYTILMRVLKQIN